MEVRHSDCMMIRLTSDSLFVTVNTAGTKNPFLFISMVPSFVEDTVWGSITALSTSLAATKLCCKDCITYYRNILMTYFVSKAVLL
jgi:hypothetical protein